MNNQSITYILIAILGIASTFIILGNSLTHPNGFLTNDSTNYLRLAERLLDGYPFTVPNDGRGVAEDRYFAIWPIGYSAMIASMSYILSVDTFLASKFTNLLMLITLILLLYRKFGTDGLAVSTILLSAGTLQIFSMTWSEAPFIFFLFLLCMHVGTLLSEQEETGTTSLFYLFILLICVFLVRYIGAFAITVSFVVALLLALRGRVRDAAKIFFVSVFASAFSAAYLALNKWFTGHTTGMKRIPAPEEAGELFHALFISVVRAFLLPLLSWNPLSIGQNLVGAVFLISFIFVVFQLFSATRNKVAPSIRDHSLTFVIFGVTYLAAITVARFTTHFDGFSYRLINPASVLIFVGLFLYILSAYRSVDRKISYFLILAMLLSIGDHSYSIIMHMDEPGYLATDQQRRERYASIPDGAIVLFGQIHLNYLRPSVHMAYPYFKPYWSIDEPIDVFLESLDDSRPIFLDVGESALRQDRYHPSVHRWVRGFPDGVLMEIDDIQARTR